MFFKMRTFMLFVLFSIFSIGQANAAFIVGDLYADENNVFWEFVGSYDLADAPNPSDEPILYNGVEAAREIFGELVNGEYALSTDNEIVNHLAIYDSFSAGITENSESFTITDFGDAGYNTFGDISAYVNDSTFSFSGFNINNVFKSVEVPEPSTVVFFSLILVIFSNRYLKKQ